MSGGGHEGRTRVTVGDALSAAMRERGLNQSETARLLGVDQQIVSSWARGETKPSPKYERAVARFLEVSVAELRAMKLLVPRRSTSDRLAAVEAGLVEVLRRLERLEHSRRRSPS